MYYRFSSSSCFVRWKHCPCKEGGSALKVPQNVIQRANLWDVVWPGSISECLTGRAGLQQMFYCLTASFAAALLHMTEAEFEIEMVFVISVLPSSRLPVRV